jgi:trimeric autotransporter adhesin
MTINRTTLLDLPLPVTGTESGTWGDVTNNGLTQYLDIAIAGRTALTSANFVAGALTISTTEGDSGATNIVAGSAQYATLYVSSLAANSTITAPSSNRAYRVINADATYTLTVKASGQTGVTFPVSTSGTVVFNGTDYQIVDTFSTLLNVDNLRLDGNTLSATNTNGNVTLSANGTGRVQVTGTSAVAGGIEFYEDTDTGTNYIALQAPSSVASNVTFTLPAADGSNGQAIITNGSGTLSFGSAGISTGKSIAMAMIFGF